MFNQDLSQEQILTPIFYDMVFKNYLDLCWGSQSELIKFSDNSDLQYAGVDVITHTIYGDIKTDIKCQTNTYINNPTPTFCLELSFYKQEELRDGWFLKDDQLTDYFLFVWIPNAITINNYINKQEQLNEVEFMLVYKQDIWDFLNSIEITKNSLRKAAESLRNITQNSFKRGTTEIVKLKRSDHLPEAPINLIISKQQYLKMPHTQCFYYNKSFGNKIFCLQGNEAKQYLKISA